MATNSADYTPLGYQPALDGLRAVAIAWVIAFHYSNESFPFAGGFLGVYAFFVLSGFLITRLLVDEWQATGQIRLKEFYRRRVARLLPSFAVFAVIIVVAAELGVTFYESRAQVQHGFLTSITYSTNWFAAARGNGWLGNAFSPTWSLAIEEQFYAIWPLTFVLLLRRYRPDVVGRFVSIALAAVFLQVAVRSYLAPSSLYQLFGIDGLPMSALLVGCVAALVLLTGYKPVSAEFEALVRRYWPIALVVVVPFFTRLAADGLIYQRGGMVVVDGCLLVLLGAAYLDTPVRRALRARPLVYIGRRSYEIYLVHLPVALTVIGIERQLGIHFGLVTLAIISVPTSVLVAEVLYRFVGRPLRAIIAGPRPVTESRTPL